MKTKRSERGQALILIVFAAVGLFAFAALAIDGSRVFSDRRHAQNAADTAVLAAALAHVRGQDFVTVSDTAKGRALSNGFNDGVNSIVEVHQCSEAGLAPPCEGLPDGADLDEYIQVVIRMNTPTTFARILGREQVPTVVSAIARAVTGGPGVSVGAAAISALSEHDPNAIHGNGNFDLYVNNGGIFDNSDAAGGCPNSNALLFNGDGEYVIENGIEIVGADNYCEVGSVDVNAEYRRTSPMPYPPAIDIPAPEIACEGNTTAAWSGTGWIVPPGTHTYQDIPGGDVTFAPGNHCFPAGFRLSGNTPNITANDAKFLISGGEFQINSNGSFNCRNLLVHVNGGTGMGLNGNGTNTCTGVTFFMSTGDVTWNGNSANTFSAPTSGRYQGLLVYLPFGNSNELVVTGNANSSFTGSIIAVSSHIRLQGNTQTLTLSTQIMGYTVEFSGNGTFQIDYNPSLQFGEGNPTMIQLTK